MICCENIVDINCSLLAYIYSSGFDYQTITSVFIKKKKKKPCLSCKTTQPNRHLQIINIIIIINVFVL